MSAIRRVMPASLRPRWRPLNVVPRAVAARLHARTTLRRLVQTVAIPLAQTRTGIAGRALALTTSATHTIVGTTARRVRASKPAWGYKQPPRSNRARAAAPLSLQFAPWAPKSRLSKCLRRRTLWARRKIIVAVTAAALAALALALAHVAVQILLPAVPSQMPTVAQARTVVAPQAQYAAQIINAAQPAIAVLVVTSALSWLMARCTSSTDIKREERTQSRRMPRLSDPARRARRAKPPPSAKPASPPLANAVACQIVRPASCRQVL
jgi:hypothetical protein